MGKHYFSTLKPNEPSALKWQTNRALPLWENRRILNLMSSLRFLIPIGALLLVSCGASTTAGGFDAASPAARSKAIQTAAIAMDFSAISRIVEQLDSDDPVIRMLAIASLQRLTGETYGYKHYHPAYVRHEAIAKWVKAVQSGSVPHLANSPAALRDEP